MTTCTLREAIEIFEDELPEIRRACLDNAGKIIESYSPSAELNVDEEVTVEGIKKHINYLAIEAEAKPLFITVRRIDSYRAHQQNPNTSAYQITDLDIQNAREASADWFIYEASLSTKKPHKGICPFHADRTPSLTLMKAKGTGKNYLKCFVCDEAWDAIKFIMARDGLDFMGAVKVIIS